MAKDTYQALQAQIRKLQEKAEAVRLKQRQPVIASILRSMQEYDITLEELKAAQAKGVPGRKRGAGAGKQAAAKPAKQVAPKYRHPETGATWTGRGKPPRWLVAAEAAGATRDQFLINK